MPFAGPLDQPVGRPVDEAADAEGPRGTYGCACVSRDARNCLIVRYGYREDLTGFDEKCQCLCHEWSDDDDECN